MNRIIIICMMLSVVFLAEAVLAAESIPQEAIPLAEKCLELEMFADVSLEGLYLEEYQETAGDVV